MTAELVDPTDWADVTKQIDGEFGDGITKSLLGERVPISMKRGETRSFYLVPMEWINRIGDYEQYEIQSMGERLGDLVRGRFRFSLQILGSLVNLTDRVIVVSGKGAEAFTYGRSILKESLVELDSRLKRGQRVLVLNKNRECIGLAALSVDGSKLNRLAREKLVAKNLVDIGAYVRGA